ncbi:MAG: VOC family protein, partial [Streptosporangiaceae bacterium]
MALRTSTPAGAPCWADLWTTDAAGSRRFYSELFGWAALEPSPEFGGYWMFARDGAPVAGGMGSMAHLTADNTWKPYFCT